ncbi:MAG TPA: PHP domain-containing protein [Thermoanaerobaculia bacterium]|nr:PHP domain-containing protein [Thermoanaerobaculia bacterium]
MRYADLHTHTFHSDGTRSPAEVVDLAIDAGLGILSISDHDNLAAFHQIRDYAADRGLLLVVGTELSAEYRGIDIHLLAYAFDPHDQPMEERLARFRETRRTRGHRMVERLRELGHDILIERVEQLCGEGAMGRPHIARALMEIGAVDSFEEAFATLIGPGCPGWVAKERFTIQEVVDLVGRAGGVTSVAHPTLYPDHGEITAELLDLGIDAVEVFHPDVDAESSELYQALARERGKFVTGGSDDHGAAKSLKTIGTVRISEERIGPIVERLEARG